MENESKGYLKVRVTRAGGTLPIEGDGIRDGGLRRGLCHDAGQGRGGGSDPQALFPGKDFPGLCVPAPGVGAVPDAAPRSGLVPGGGCWRRMCLDSGKK